MSYHCTKCPEVFSSKSAKNGHQAAHRSTALPTALVVRQVDEWLAYRRNPQPVKVSVSIWAECDRVRTNQIKRGRKITTYLPDEILNEAQADANRRGRSLSQSIQQAWELAREKIFAYPGAPT